jgi:hypothetical protein
MTKKKGAFKERSYSDSDAKKFEIATELLTKEASFADASMSMIERMQKDPTLRGDWTFTGILQLMTGKPYLDWLSDYKTVLHNASQMQAIKLLSRVGEMRGKDAVDAAVAIASGRSSPRFKVVDHKYTAGRPPPQMMPLLKDGAASVLGLDPVKDDQEELPDYLIDDESED